MFLSEQDLALVGQHQPLDRPHESLMQAAVAMVLRDSDDGTEVLMMQRALHENDPWSGQMAFPGGKIESSDQSAKDAAIRETHEEVGLVLHADDYVGRLDDVYGLKVNQTFSVHVACFVFKPSRDIELSTNYEVADTVWLPLSFLQNADNASDYYHPHDSTVKMPAVMINAEKEQILWGLSLRMLSIFFEMLGHELTVISKLENKAMNEIEQGNIELESEHKFLRKIQRRN